MNPLTLLSAIFLLFFASHASAEMITLKDGRSVAGKILEKTPQSIKVEVNGMAMTYYNDDIKDIDGVAIATPTPAPAIAAPAAPAATASAITPLSIITPEKRALILKFMDVFGTRQALAQNFEAMMNHLPADKPEESAKLRERIKVDEIVEQLIPVYDRNFSTEDLQGFIDFYDSPKGHKLVSTIPIVMKESIEVSAKYLQDKFPELQGK